MVSASQAVVAGLFEKTGVAFVLTTCLWLAGCASRPWVVQAMPGEPSDVTSVVETEVPTFYIIVQPTEQPVPAPEVVVQPRPVARDGWTPEAFPVTNPFERFRTWVGDYDCVQGNTDFKVRIMDVRGRAVRAVFEFLHAPSGAKGSYVITGTFDADTRRVYFEPSSWIDQPDNYVMVPMTGEVSADHSLFAGKIDFQGCGAFRLKPTR